MVTLGTLSHTCAASCYLNHSSASRRRVHLLAVQRPVLALQRPLFAL